MSAVDFGQWAAPDLEITLGGRTFMVSPPCVADARKVIAAAVRGEVNLGIVTGSIPDEVQEVLLSIKPDEHPALGKTYGEMVAAGIDAQTIDRVGYYAVFYWARGKKYADSLAAILWAPRVLGEREGGDASPKAQRPPRSGRRTASASQTKTAGTRRTGSSRKG